MRTVQERYILRADVGVRGVQQTQATVLFDVPVVDTDAKSCVVCTSQSVLENAERKRSQSAQIHVTRSMSVLPRSASPWMA